METHRSRRYPSRALRAAAAGLALAAMASAGAQTVSLNSGGKQIRIAIGGAATLPEDLPQDVALPAAATLVRVQRDSGSTTLEFSAADSPDAAIADLDARMLAGGWRKAAVATPGMGRAQAWEKDARAVIAWATPEDAAPQAGDVMDAQRVRIQLQLIARTGAPPQP